MSKASKQNGLKDQQLLAAMANKLKEAVKKENVTLKVKSYASRNWQQSEGGKGHNERIEAIGKQSWQHCFQGSQC